MALNEKDIQDLVQGTLERVRKDRVTNLATRLSDYHIVGVLLKKQRVRIEDGISIQQMVMIDHSHAAQQTELFAVDNVRITDTLKRIEVPWRHTTVNWGFESREIDMNSGDSRIVSLLATRQDAAMVSLLEHMENQGWKPAAELGERDVYSIPCWVVKNATEGFYGGNPTGFTNGIGGLDSNTYTRWRNWTGTYSAWSETDGILALRKAHQHIQFKVPIDVKTFREGVGRTYRIMVNNKTYNELITAARNANDNLGPDLGRYDGSVTFNRNEITWVPKLDEDTQNPVYLINLNSFYAFVLKGWFMKTTGPLRAPSQHNTWHMFEDTTWNLICENRRLNAVLYYVPNP